ncbi:MAG: trehalose-6-phosphate synthase [Polyangiaceae bacterium]
MRDVRSLAERIAAEHEQEARTSGLSPERPARRHPIFERRTSRDLANREPYIHERTPTGTKVLHPASAPVTALEPVMRACSGVWVAHGAAARTGDGRRARSPAVPPGEESPAACSAWVWMTEEEENGYYYGFSNEGLWPLCHAAHARPIFRLEDWEHYVAVNRKSSPMPYARRSTSDEPIILVQDYHFALAPKMIREKLPRATILTFWHIPWPNAERIGICPWHDEIIAGLLGSSIVGFHTQQHCNNFIDSVDAFMESRIDREANAVVQGARRTLVRPYPISIEWPVHWMDGIATVAECRAALRRELGLSPDALLGVGIDRLDYTKGVEERLQAVDSP